jgi:D-alanyl-lipoteichoic acid acyltransferase DltB (MBOAT superfamily)
LLIGTSALDFYLAKAISKTDEAATRKTFLAISILSNIGVLFVFKYFIFFYNTGLSLFNPNAALLTNLIIPAGLSFYTFQSISYTIDVYRRKYKADDTLQDFLLYVSFFPHMVAGPIVRHHTLMPQLKTVHYWKTIEWAPAVKLIVWGYFKKMVIADNLALIVDPVFDKLPGDFNSLEYVITGFLFLVQLYADFSGYSDIAIGVAKLFRINLSLNWNRPLLATSVSDYWKRHHISLTGWFKDYVYISLGGNRVSTPRWVFNILIVFVLSGFWHGASFTFIIWGLLNGIFYLFEHIPLFKRVQIPQPLRRLYTLFFISVFFIAFRANTTSDLEFIYREIFLKCNLEGNMKHLLSINDRIFNLVIALMVGFLFLKEIGEENHILKPTRFKDNFLRPAFYLVVGVFIFAFGNFNANSFIYFQF